MDQKIAVITGGAGSIGVAAARRLTREGYRVAILDINREGAERVGKELDTPAVYAPCHVESLEEVQKTVRDVEDRFGEIAVLVNAAGGNQGMGFTRKPYWEIDLTERETLIKANLYGTLNTCYAVLPGMIGRRRGNIVNIASGQGLKGGAGLATYSAAKGAVVTFTQAVSLEAAPYGVRVNSIAPGAVQSAWRIDETAEERRKVEASLPLRRRTSPEDIAAAISFLVSEEASHITGTCIDVSGGVALH